MTKQEQEQRKRKILREMGYFDGDIETFDQDMLDKAIELHNTDEQAHALLFTKQDQAMTNLYNNLDQQIADKADTSTVTALQTTVDSKADKTALETTNTAVSILQSTMVTKANQSDLNTLIDRVDILEQTMPVSVTVSFTQTVNSDTVTINNMILPRSELTMTAIQFFQKYGRYVVGTSTLGFVTDEPGRIIYYNNNDGLYTRSISYADQERIQDGSYTFTITQN